MFVYKRALKLTLFLNALCEYFSNVDLFSLSTYRYCIFVHDDIDCYGNYNDDRQRKGGTENETQIDDDDDDSDDDDDDVDSYG